MKKNRKLIVTLFLLLVVIAAETRKTTRNRNSGSGRGSSRKTSQPQPVPTSFSNPQSNAAKPIGWQEKPAQRTQTYPSKQSQPSGNQGHSYPSSNTGQSYPSSNTGLSGNSPPKQPPNYQESVQRSNSYNSHVQQTASGTIPKSHNQPINSNNPPSHSYPSSNGMSGNTGPGVGYPSQQGSGLSGSGAGYPSQQGKGLSGSAVGYPSQQGGGLSGTGAVKPGDVNRPHNGGNYPQQHPTNYHGNSNNHPQGPPPPYTNYGSNYGGYGHGQYNPGHGSQMPGYFGNYGNNFGSVGRTGTSTLTKVGIAGAGIGTVLTGLALWNLARSTGRNHHTVIYDNKGQPVAVTPTNDTQVPDSFLGDLVNCTLTISNDNATEVLAIPCAIATSFRPDADIKDSRSTTDSNDNTKCTITVVTKSEREYMTTIPCSILLSTAAENNVTEPPLLNNGTDVFNETMTNPGDLINTNQTSALMLTGTNTEKTNISLNCTLQPPDIQDPINPCLPVTHNLTVIPLQSSQNDSTLFTPGSA